MLLGTNHFYNGYALILSATTPSQHLSDIVNTIMHPQTHFTLMITSQGHFLYAILNSETIYLIEMIYNTIVYCFATPILFTIHYPSLITQQDPPLFLDMVGIAIGKGIIHAFHIASNCASIFGSSTPSFSSSQIYLSNCIFPPLLITWNPCSRSLLHLGRLIV